ncbi:SulP family inorganic anion transporter [Campylobacter ureolyticus]|uniref:SulP family inorganic anion transporter n=1 Tax=Campylobacter ureolyticus TaxID=827 RepID=UPI0034C62287
MNHCNDDGWRNACSYRFFKRWINYKIIPYPVVAGFTSGIAVTIFSSQIKDILGLGVEKIPAQFMEQILCYIQNIQTLNLYAILITIVSIFIIILWPKIPKIGKLIPSMLVSVVVLTLLVQFLHFPLKLLVQGLEVWI